MIRLLPVLDRKLLRDLWRLRGQVLAIAFVIAAGSALLVMSTSTYAALDATKRAYYERTRFADVFAPVTRAPVGLIERLRRIDGVTAAEGRISAFGRVDLPGAPPISARLVSYDASAAAPLNGVTLSAGRMIAPGRSSEILLLDAFARATGLGPGDDITVTADGQRETFRIVGTAYSPEFIFAMAPGEFVSNDARFAVIWASREALEAAFDLDGAFNDALLTLSRDADLLAVIETADRLLAPYGGAGAYAREDQTSDRYLTEDLEQLRVMDRIMTPLFLGVSAFLLNVVIGRLVQTEREEIGLLKAFGRSGGEVGWHYLKFALAVAVLGGVLGWLGGLYLGARVSALYSSVYHFPFLLYDPPVRALGTSVLAGVASAGIAAVLAVRAAAALPPAIAMRPPVPPDYGGRGSLPRWLDQPSRMVARRILRAPLKAALTIVGIGAAMSLTVMMGFNAAAVDEMVVRSFDIADRHDVGVTFTDPRGRAALFALGRIDGVQRVEGRRDVPVRFVNGTSERLGSITGLSGEAELSRALGADLRPLDMPAGGLVLSQSLARLLGAEAGDEITVDVRTGSRPLIALPVAATADALIGTPAYMDEGALGRLLGEEGRVSGAVLMVDSARADAVTERLREAPIVLGVSLQSEALAELDRMLDEGPGLFRRIMMVVSIVIAVGVVYNSARIAFIERARDLASLRVLGFTSAEAGYVLLGELALLTVIALPVGGMMGVFLWIVVAQAVSTDLYSIPTVFDPRGFGVAALTVLISSVAAGLLVMRDVRRLDLVSALKVRE